jgi:acetyl esterase/lipase
MANRGIVAIRALLAANPMPEELAAARREADARGGRMPHPPGLTLEPVDAGGVPGELGWLPAASREHAILYLHGGGYRTGSLASHRSLVAEIGSAAGATTLALAYRLAPEHPFPAAVHDAVAGYRWLLARGLAPSRVGVAGDSAGGGLALALLVALRDAGLPLPAGAFCISPWVDLTLGGASIETKAGEDPLVDRASLVSMARDYLDGADPQSPLASPLHAHLAGLPPLLIQVGGAETLLDDDSVRLAGAAGAAGVKVTLEVWPEMLHVWHAFHPMLAEARAAVAGAGAFLRSCTRR